MPIYEYRCPDCKKTKEVLQKIGALPPMCEPCQLSMHRQISRTSFVLKGGGWFADSYSSKQRGQQ